MSDGANGRFYWRSVLLGALLTMGGLFGLQEWYRTYMEVYAPDLGGDLGREVEALRAEQREALATGPMPIDRAMRMLAERGRTASALISPEASTDPAPAAGWMHHPRYEPPPAPEPPAPAPAPAPVPEGSPERTPEQAAAPAPAAPTPAAADRPARRPAKAPAPAPTRPTAPTQPAAPAP